MARISLSDDEKSLARDCPSLVVEFSDGVHLWPAGKRLRNAHPTGVAQAQNRRIDVDIRRELRTRGGRGGNHRVDSVHAYDLEKRIVYCLGRNAGRDHAWQTRTSF